MAPVALSGDFGIPLNLYEGQRIHRRPTEGLYTLPMSLIQILTIAMFKEFENAHNTR